MESDSSKHLVSSPNLLASKSSCSQSHDMYSWWNKASNLTSPTLGYVNTNNYHVNLTPYYLPYWNTMCFNTNKIICENST